VISVGFSPAGTELQRIVSSNPGAEKTKVRLIGSAPTFFTLSLTDSSQGNSCPVEKTFAPRIDRWCLASPVPPSNSGGTSPTHSSSFLADLPSSAPSEIESKNRKKTNSPHQIELVAICAPLHEPSALAVPLPLRGWASLFAASLPRSRERNGKVPVKVFASGRAVWHSRSVPATASPLRRDLVSI
jgi:hypothetical protein